MPRIIIFYFLLS